MEMIQKDSSMIKAAGYDDSRKVLRIEFNKGSMFEYSGVSEEVYQAFITSPSIGRAFNGMIKNNFQYIKIN